MKVLFLLILFSFTIISMHLPAQPNTSAKLTGKCFCSSNRHTIIRNTHAEATGLLPDYNWLLTGGEQITQVAESSDCTDLQAPGAEMAGIHDTAANFRKEPLPRPRYATRFVRYWVRTKHGYIVCLSLLLQYSFMAERGSL